MEMDIHQRLQTGVKQALFSILILSFTSASVAQQASDMEARFGVLFNQLQSELSDSQSFSGITSLDAAIAHSQVNGATVVLIDKGRIEARHFGLKSSVSNLGTDSDTFYDAASLGKFVSGLVFSVAHERNDLLLNNTVADFAAVHPKSIVGKWAKKVFKNDTENYKEDITVRRLLQHNAGLDTHGIGLFPDTTTCNNIKAVVRGKVGCGNGVEPMFAPGEQYDYSGGGYTVAESMLETVTDQSFSDYATEHVLNPIGMTRSTYDTPRSHWDDFARGCSRGNCNNNVQHMNMKAAGGLLAHPVDYAKLLQVVMYGGRSVNSNGIVGGRIFPASAIRKLYVPAKDIESTKTSCQVPLPADVNTIVDLSAQTASCPALATSAVWNWGLGRHELFENPQVCLKNRCQRIIRTTRYDENSSAYGLGVRLRDQLAPDGLPRYLEHAGAHYGSNNKHGLSAEFYIDRYQKLGILVFVNGEMEWCNENGTSLDACPDNQLRGAKILRPLLAKAFRKAFRSELNATITSSLNPTINSTLSVPVL